MPYQYGEAAPGFACAQPGLRLLAGRKSSHPSTGNHCKSDRIAMPVSFEVNGKRVTVEVEPRMTLVDCLRHQLRLTGTHVGCEHGVCGACTILLDGEAVRACLILAVQAEGCKVVTIEGLSNVEALTPLQASFRRPHAVQCGFCTPGMITTAHALLTAEPDCDADRVREVLSGNICRCTGYISIVEAVLDARSAYRAPESQS